MAFCSNCGGELTYAGARFCERCGKPAEVAVGVLAQQSAGLLSTVQLPQALTVLGSLLLVVGAFLPFVTATVLFATVTLTMVKGGTGDGMFVVVLACAAVVLGLSRLWRYFPVLAAGVLSLGIVVWDMADVANRVSSSSSSSVVFSFDWGVIVLILGGLLLLLVPFVPRRQLI